MHQKQSPLLVTYRNCCVVASTIDIDALTSKIAFALTLQLSVDFGNQFGEDFWQINIYIFLKSISVKNEYTYFVSFSSIQSLTCFRRYKYIQLQYNSCLIHRNIRFIFKQKVTFKYTNFQLGRNEHVALLKIFRILRLNLLEFSTASDCHRIMHLLRFGFTTKSLNGLNNFFFLAIICWQ